MRRNNRKRPERRCAAIKTTVSYNPRMNINLTTATRVGLNVLALLGVIVGLRLGMSIFIPLVIAALLATILWPSAIRLNTFYHLPWPIACFVAVSVLVLIDLVVLVGF